MGRRPLGERDMQTREGGLANADRVRSSRQARHLGTTTGKVGLAQQLGGLSGRTLDDRAESGM
jgi:hypothetical protein